MKRMIQSDFGKIFLAAVLGSGLTVGGFTLFANKSKPVIIETAAQTMARSASFTPGNVDVAQPDFTYAAAKVTPAVVHITSTTEQRVAQGRQQQQLPEGFREFFGDDFFESPQFRQGTPQPQVGSGSGVIISEDGYVITNNHVVENADKLEVILSDKRSYTAKVIGADPNTDIALIKIDADNLPTLTFANSDQIKVGQWVVAAGYPLALESTVTAGIVSAKGRNIGIIGRNNRDRLPIESFIQTDAAINPGNSGGALVNANGDLIGINTAIASPTGSYAGYGFAVPSNLVYKVKEDLLKYGAVQRAYLGVMIRDINSQLAKEKDLNVSKGVYVDSLVANGSADKAGVKVGDVVLKINEQPVNSVAELQEQVGLRRPGDAVTLLINRNGTEKTLKIPLKGLEGNTAIVKAERNETANALGAEFANLTDKEKKDYGVSYGVRVKNLFAGKLRSETPIRPGFIIQKINGKDVHTVNELLKAIEVSQDEVYGVGVYPKDSQKIFFGFNK